MNNLQASVNEAMKSGQLDPIAQKFIDNLAAQGGEPIYKLSFAEARNVLDSLQSQPIEKLPAEIEDHTIPGGPTGDISIRIIRPEESHEILPVVMFFHGGGWVLGNKNTHDRLVREIANGADAAVVFVDYTPAPDAQYPTQIEQAYFATSYIAEQGERFNLDPSRLVVVGDSVGGNMAAVVTLLAAERGGPTIDYQVLFYPVTDAGMNTSTYQQYADGPWLTKPAMEWFWNAYAPDANTRNDWRLSPLRAPLELLSNVPPALIIIDENDVLRDEGEAYARRLMQAGVDVIAVRYLGMIHDFVMLNPVADTTATSAAISQASNILWQVLYAEELELAA